VGLVKKTLRGILWNYASYYSGRLLVFLSTIILARLLTQEDFGIAGYAIVVISFLDVVNELGIGAALIYYDERPEVADTAFWLGLGVSVMLFATTWFAAPLVGDFFRDARAIPITRVLAFTFPLTALGSVQYALLQKSLAFGRKTIPDVGRALGKGIVSITLALMGAGAWSLIIGQLGGVLIWLICLWIVHPWRPSLRFHGSLARPILSYGTGSMLLDGLSMFQTNADYLFIGRFLGAVALGVYTLAFRLPDMLIMQFCMVIARVTFPAYTKVRDEPLAFRRGFLATIRYVALITVPLSTGMVLVAEPFVLAIFTEKWAEVIPVLQPLAIATMLLSLSFNAGEVYKAQGRLGVLNRLTLLEIAVMFPAMYWAVKGPGTIAAVAWVHVIVALVSCVLELFVACRLINTPFSMVLAHFRPALVGVAGMTLVVVGILALTTDASSWVQLVASVAGGGGAYLATLWLLERAVVSEAIQMMRLVVSKQE
jgi:O-antigen/teichoic acid export membrane protein